MNCNNCTNNNALKEVKIKHVYGNVLRLAIPLTLRTIELVDGEINATDTPFVPSSEYPVKVVFTKKGAIAMALDATMKDGNIAYVEEKGKIPVGTYAITVTCNDDNGNPYRFKQNAVLFVADATIEAGIEETIEYEVTTWYLDAAIFLALKGEDGVGIDDIETQSSGEIGGVNTVTFILTDGRTRSFNILNGSGAVDSDLDINSPSPIANSAVTAKFNELSGELADLFGDVDYDSSSKTIRFWDKGKAIVLASLDARPFIKDGMVSNAYISNNTLVITFNTDSGKEAIGVPLTSVFNPNNYYTKTQVDSRIASAVANINLSNYYTKSQVDNKLIGLMAKEDFVYEGSVNLKYGSAPEIVLSYIENVSAYGEDHARLFGTSNGHIKGYVGAVGGDLFDYGLAPLGLVFLDKTSGLFYRWNVTAWQQVGGSGSGGYTPPVGGIPKIDLAPDVQASLGKADTALQSSDLDGYATTDDVDDAVAALVSSAPQTLDTLNELADALGDDPNFATTMATQLGNKVDKETGKSLMTDAERTKLQGIAAGAEVNVQPNWKQTNTSADDYIKNKPTKVSDFTNDSGFTSNAGTITGITMNGASKGTSGVVDLGTVITAHQDISGKANASDVYTKTQTDTLLAGKQNTLTSSTTLMTINGNAVHYGESVTVQGEKGEQGETGHVQVDGNGNVLIYNGRDKTTTGAALDAYQGQFIGKMLNAKDNTFYNVWVGTQAELEALEEYDDNTIYIVGTIPTVVQRFNVSFNGGDHTSVPASTPQTVKEGSAFSVVVSPAIGYTIDTATGTMVGGTLTKANNQDGTVTFSTTAVTGAITITAAATKHITGITVSAGTRSGNSIPLTAVVVPSGAENVTLAWSVNDTTNFGISGSGASATLTVKSGASNSSVTITCQDTNASSGTASGTLQLTGLSYADVPIPVTEITDITATRTAANTLTLEATADGNTPITFSIVGTAPKSKKLNYNNSPATLEEVDSVVLSGDTLSYKEDCKVTIQASAENGTVTFQKEFTITHDSADAIWFEDEVTLTALNSNNVGSGGKVTYAQAAAVTVLKSLAGNTSIRRFKEFMWFTAITGAGNNSSDKSKFIGCSNLECIGIPGENIFNHKAAGAETNAFYGCKLREVHIKGYLNYKFAMSTDFATWRYAGISPDGLGLFIDGEEVYNVVIPSGAAVSKKFSGFNRITSFVAEHATSFPAGSLYGCTSLQSLKIGDDVTTFGENAIGNTSYTITSLESVDLGSGIGALGTQCFRGCTGLRTLTLRYNGVVSQNNSFYNATPISGIDLYVPANQVSAYQASSTWSGAKSINAITE